MKTITDHLKYPISPKDIPSGTDFITENSFFSPENQAGKELRDSIDIVLDFTQNHLKSWRMFTSTEFNLWFMVSPYMKKALKGQELLMRLAQVNSPREKTATVDPLIVSTGAQFAFTHHFVAEMWFAAHKKVLDEEMHTNKLAQKFHPRFTAIRGIFASVSGRYTSTKDLLRAFIENPSKSIGVTNHSLM